MATRVLTHLGRKYAEYVAAAVPDVEAIAIRTDGPLAADVEGEVLLTAPWLIRVLEYDLEVLLDRGVRWIHNVGTGMDGFPFAAVGDRQLTCARGAGAVPISEWVLAVMLAFEKDLPESWLDGPTDSWNIADLGTLQGCNLGLVGLGGIGTAIAERAAPFGMHIRALRRTPTPPDLPGVELAPSITALAGWADHLVLAAPATPQTRRIIDEPVLARAKPGLHLINIARGALVDQDALRTALDEGRVARASLDTVEPEPLPDGHWMYDHPKIRLSPHISWAWPGGYDLLVDAFIDNLRRFLVDAPPEGIVDQQAGY